MLPLILSYLLIAAAAPTIQAMLTPPHPDSQPTKHLTCSDDLIVGTETPESLSQRDNYGLTKLMQAIVDGNIVQIQHLLAVAEVFHRQRKLDICFFLSLRDNHGNTSINLAAAYGRLDAIRTMKDITAYCGGCQNKLFLKANNVFKRPIDTAVDFFNQTTEDMEKLKKMKSLQEPNFTYHFRYNLYEKICQELQVFIDCPRHCRHNPTKQ